MNQIIIFLFLLNILTIATSKLTLFKQDFHHKLRNMMFTIVIFKEKKIHKLCDVVKNTLNAYYNKGIVIVADSYLSYNDLSEEDKIIIETIIGLCY